MHMTLSTTSFWIDMCETMYWEAMSTDEHQLFKMTLSFMMLSLHTERSLTLLWSFILSFYFCKASDALNCCFKEMHQVFLKWLFTIFKKYDSLSRNNDSDSQMFMKIKVKILVFWLLMLCSRLLMNLMSAHISHTFLWLLLMKIDFFKVMILWSWRSFADSRWVKWWCHSLYNLKLLSFAKLSWSWSTSISFSWWIMLVWDAEWSRFIESLRFIELCIAENADEMSRCIADSNANSSRSFAILFTM